jgi:CshA-type fibril repeat protein
LVASTVKLCDPDSNPAEVAPNCTLTSLTIDGEGTYTVDPATGIVTFDPLDTFTGPATQIDYQISDSRGEVAASTINVSVSPPVAPELVDDYSTDIVNLTQVFSITDNDKAAPGLTLDLSTARLCADGETPNACTETSVTVAGVGTYTLAANGEITFVPVTDYVGEADPISYVVSDSFGQVATAQIYVVVTPTPKPLAVDDTSTDSVNRTQTINLLTNDSSPEGYPLVPGSVTLCGLDPVEASPNCTQTTVEIAEQGTLTISNGIVTFTPVADFVGEVDPVSYQVANSYGEKATAVIYITVTPAPVITEAPPAPPAPPITAEQEPWPTANPDRKSGPMNQTITLSAWLNDEMAEAQLSATSIRFCDSLCLTADGEDGTYLTERTVAEGTWSLDPNTGIISFTPMRDWHGTVSINYAIWATDGKLAHSSVTVVIQPPQLAQEALADTGFTSQQLFFWAVLMLMVGAGIVRQGGRKVN